MAGAHQPFAPFDRVMQDYMRPRGIPGGALAVVKDRRLVYARGYGWANPTANEPVRPDSLFRIASITKPFTALAVLKLVSERRLELDRPAFPLLQLEPASASRAQPDPRLEQITIRQLLHHTAGWDRERSFDPMFASRRIARALGIPSPPGPRDIIRFMLGQPLDFDPGSRYAYSNFGYCVLGRVIESASGRPYGTYVRQELLRPMGIKRMRLGATLEAGRAPGEVTYSTASDKLARSVFPNTPRLVPWPYGGFCLESMDAHGGWIASVLDLARFAAVLDTPEHPVFPKLHLPDLYEPPAAPVFRNAKGRLKDWWYGCGWAVRPTADHRANYWHTGSLPGSYGLLVRRHDGLAWAALFNRRSGNAGLPSSAIDPALHHAADAVRRWPRADLFRSIWHG